ncbi:hypothetical protein BS50DRAFT_571058 [Corynespora cassiicola Philippines]|uniref:Azaphilone pigments biosynthesis cluster protein L N-terminal domain-containing protein n=1 Tax=Corynespora cassiicola Philippines TaxID=1448308 RepID=A0A2T2NX69_CORCC|nr:hypothetical protein BS50DRAFT_571058 [Corynespora cassiicola Philippines]
MADPLGLAAGIAGLLSLTIQVIQIVNKFKDDVGSAKTEVVTLVRELVALKHILESLETAWREKKLPPDFDSSALAGIQKACKTQLKILLGKLNKAAGKSQSAPFFGIRRSVFCLKWPFEVEKTREVIDNLHRYFSIFSWALHFHERL